MKYLSLSYNTNWSQTNQFRYFATSTANCFTSNKSRLIKEKLSIRDIEDRFKKDKMLDAIYKVVESHLEKEDFTIPYLANILFTTRTTLYREVKKKTGRSVIMLIKIIRLLKADVLLKTSDLSISNIAYQVGFKAPSHFTTSYKEEFGYSPKEARNLLD